MLGELPGAGCASRATTDDDDVYIIHD